MTKRKIYFRADASATIGYGHFVRTLALADMLKDDFECIFFTTSPSAYQIGEMEKVCAFVALNEDTKFESFLNLLNGDEIVVLDNYFFTSEYQQQIKAKGCKLVCVDDMHDKHYYADVVVNHSDFVTPPMFEKENNTRLCLGRQWYLLRKPFIKSASLLKERRIPHIIHNVAICFGGSDALDFTSKTIKLLLANSNINNINAIIGNNYSGEMIHEPRVHYFKNISAEKVAEIFKDSDLAVVPLSGVSIEAMACGTQIAAGWYVDNQKGAVDYMEKAGMGVCLGNLNEGLDKLQNLLDNHEGRFFSEPYVPHNIDKNYINLFKGL